MSSFYAGTRHLYRHCKHNVLRTAQVFTNWQQSPIWPAAQHYLPSDGKHFGELEESGWAAVLLGLRAEQAVEVVGDRSANVQQCTLLSRTRTVC